MTTYTANDLYDMFANQADTASIANTSIETLALDIEELDTEASITDYTAAAVAVQAIAAEMAARSAAAAALGSVRSERKAAASRENGKRGGRPRLTPEERARRRVSRSPRLSKLEDTIFYDWGEGDDHFRWISTAKVKEIEDWAEAVEAAAR